MLDIHVTKPIVVVGFTLVGLHALERFMPPDSVLFVEEPDVIAKRDAVAKVRDSVIVSRLVSFEYQTEAAADRFAAAHLVDDVGAVIPGVEYAVPFAARLAERLDVPGGSYGATRILRDKHLLRRVSGAAGIANPVSQPVAGAAEVRDFMGRMRAACILKPANRQASVGTQVLRSPDEVDNAWAQCTVQCEEPMVPGRGLPLRMLVEEYVEGREYSVEMLLDEGRPLFSNLTGKVLYPGPYPVEIGHQVPAAGTEETGRRLVSATQQVAQSTGFRTGILHCEWIVRGGEPYLVECAGRLAGDAIVDLIGEAWDIDLHAAYVQLMSGRSPALPTAPVRGAAVSFVTGRPGRLIGASGVEAARAVPDVLTAEVTTAPGSVVRPVRTSWDRVGFVTARGADSTEAWHTARAAATLIELRTVDDEPTGPLPGSSGTGNAPNAQDGTPLGPAAAGPAPPGRRLADGRLSDRRGRGAALAVGGRGPA